MAAAARAWSRRAEMLSVAAFLEGKHAQAFPSFGSERMGAPVVAFCRIDDKRNPPARADPGARRADRPGPDAASQALDVFEGLKPDGYLLVNTPRSFDELRLDGDRRAAAARATCTTVPATEIALQARRPPGAQHARCSARSPR